LTQNFISKRSIRFRTPSGISKKESIKFTLLKHVFVRIILLPKINDFLGNWEFYFQFSPPPLSNENYSFIMNMNSYILKRGIAIFAGENILIFFLLFLSISKTIDFSLKKIKF
jgi:hypothetical protein